VTFESPDGYNRASAYLAERSMSPTSLLVLLLLAQPAPEPTFAQDDLDFFEKRVRPILVARCYECHSAEAEKPRGEFFVDSRQALLDGGESGPGAMPGEPDKSRIVAAITYKDDILQMPPDGKMPDEEIQLIAEWVRRGLPFLKTDAVAKARKQIDLEAGRKHWAFQPARMHDVPLGDPWIEQRIDAFVLAKMRQSGLQPAERAARETLIRRVKFDLIGLPPEPEEVEAFLADDSPEAYSRLVDRYLASPQYGERWGRFWLDLARYADVLEGWRESQAKAYLYRDWVVQSLNDDLPYPDFVRKQLAADLLPGATPADNAALGYLGLSPTYWKELKLDHTMIKQVVAEEWEEHIEAIGGTFLGLTVACARCHDHKFDPITQRDYYALAGVLASSKLDDRPILAAELAGPAQAARTKVKELQKKLDELLKVKERSEEQQKQVELLRAEISSLQQTPHFHTPQAFGVSEARIVVAPDGLHRTKIEYKPGEAQDVPLHIRGMAANEGPVVERRYISVLTRDSGLFREGSGRRELAEAIVTDSAPLAARVMVNRVWRHHFGRGLVTTPSNFGTQAEPPSHPELLDDLTARFMASGWSLKWLHREIVLSATYQQSSHRDDAKHAVDPENVLLARMKPRRLEVEAWRDAALLVTGELDRTIGGEAVELSDPKKRRRTVYGRVKRRELDVLLRLHDFPDPVNHSASREPTTTPLQQLFALNAPFLYERSAALVARMDHEAPGDASNRVAWLYPQLFGRPATAEEIQLGNEFLAQSQAAGIETKEAWRQYCHALLGSNEFLFVD